MRICESLEIVWVASNDTQVCFRFVHGSRWGAEETHDVTFEGRREFPPSIPSGSSEFIMQLMSSSFDVCTSPECVSVSYIYIYGCIDMHAQYSAKKFGGSCPVTRAAGSSARKARFFVWHTLLNSKGFIDVVPRRRS